MKTLIKICILLFLWAALFVCIVGAEEEKWERWKPLGVTKENKVALLKCIDELPEKQKEVVYLRYYCNLDFLKISEIMRCPFNTSLSHMHKAKKNLKILLTKTNNYET